MSTGLALRAERRRTSQAREEYKLNQRTPTDLLRRADPEGLAKPWREDLRVLARQSEKVFACLVLAMAVGVSRAISDRLWWTVGTQRLAALISPFLPA